MDSAGGVGGTADLKAIHEFVDKQESTLYNPADEATTAGSTKTPLSLSLFAQQLWVPLLEQQLMIHRRFLLRAVARRYCLLLRTAPRAPCSSCRSGVAETAAWRNIAI